MANTFKSYPTAGVTTETVVYTGPAGVQTTIIGMTVANTSGADVNASVKFSDGTTTIFMVKDASILIGGALIPVGGDQKVVIEAGDTISVIADGTVDCLVSVLEIS